jgi:thymidylate synthase (FAD)
MPIYVARQWVRHRTASINEYSARYSVMKDKFDIAEPGRIKKQSTLNKQGREGNIDEAIAENFHKSTQEISRNAYSAYEKAIEEGIARETARIVLPLSTYTEWYWKIDLHNLFHFLSLRLDTHAQYEIRVYAQAMAEITKKIVPVAYQAFEDYVLNGTHFSNREQKAIAQISKGVDPEKACEIAGLRLYKIDGTRMKTGEGVEFLDKYKKLMEL